MTNTKQDQWIDAVSRIHKEINLLSSLIEQDNSVTEMSEQELDFDSCKNSISKVLHRVMDVKDELATEM